MSVVIPTYNRARLLERTVPTYVQPGVEEILLVDDASSDDTRAAAALLARNIPQLRYFCLPRNRRQMFAKNFGVTQAKTPLIYFGDDDSIMAAGSIPLLMQTLEEKRADIVGAKALYAQGPDDVLDLAGLIGRHEVFTDDITKIADLETLQFNFTLSTREAVEIPVTQACFLIRREWALRVGFDEHYILNGYREETDFLLRAYLAGARILYQSRAVQVNLPREEATGGAHAAGHMVWLLACVYNNWRFLRRNYPLLMRRQGVRWNLYRLQWEFMTRGMGRTLRKWAGRNRVAETVDLPR